MIKKLTRLFQIYGVVGTIQFLCTRILRVIPRTQWLLQLDKEDLAQNGPALNETIEIRRYRQQEDITDDTIRGLAAQKLSSDAFIKHLRSILSNDGEIWVASIEGEPAGYGCSYHYTGSTHDRFILSQCDAFLHTDEVLPAFRRRGIQSNLLRCRIAQLCNEKTRRLSAFIFLWNLPSWKSVMRTGFKPVGRFYRFHRNKRSLWLWSVPNECKPRTHYRPPDSNHDKH